MTPENPYQFGIGSISSEEDSALPLDFKSLKIPAIDTPEFARSTLIELLLKRGYKELDAIRSLDQQNPLAWSYRSLVFHKEYLEMECLTVEGVVFKSLIEYSWIRFEFVAGIGLFFKSPRGNLYIVLNSQCERPQDVDILKAISTGVAQKVVRRNTKNHDGIFGIHSQSPYFPRIESPAVRYSGTLTWKDRTSTQTDKPNNPPGRTNRFTRISAGILFIALIVCLPLFVALIGLEFSLVFAILGFFLILPLAIRYRNEQNITAPNSRLSQSTQIAGWVSQSAIIDEVPGQRNIVPFEIFDSFAIQENAVTMSAKNTLSMHINRKLFLSEEDWHQALQWISQYTSRT
jgi:hypothetical protein